jgi:tRNA pseudouridine38-40 synthase
MVRSLVAVLIAVGRGQMAPDEVEPLLEARRRALYGRAAPARGLTLERIQFKSQES